MSIIKLSKQIPDPRVTGRTVHKMEHIIYITIAAVLAGCQTWDDIAEFGRTKKEFFKSRLVGLEHIPSHDTFNRFFSIFDPKGFEQIFRNWVNEIIGEVKGIVAIDGKLMRGSSKCDSEHTLGKDIFVCGLYRHGLQITISLWLKRRWATRLTKSPLYQSCLAQ